MYRLRLLISLGVAAAICSVGVAAFAAQGVKPVSSMFRGGFYLPIWSVNQDREVILDELTPHLESPAIVDNPADVSYDEAMEWAATVDPPAVRLRDFDNRPYWPAVQLLALRKMGSLGYLRPDQKGWDEEVMKQVAVLQFEYQLPITRKLDGPTLEAIFEKKFGDVVDQPAPFTLGPVSADAPSIPVASGSDLYRHVEGQLRVIAVTSLFDTSGESGSDYVVAGGNHENRGAPVGSLFSGRVVDVTLAPAEFHKEKGQPGSGFGNQVTVRVPVFKDGVQIGEADMLYAHFDDVLVEKGEIVDGDQIIGTQGRSGSTTGAHVSVDIYPVDGNIEAQNELLRQMRAKIQGR